MIAWADEEPQERVRVRERVPSSPIKGNVRYGSHGRKSSSHMNGSWSAPNSPAKPKGSFGRKNGQQLHLPVPPLDRTVLASAVEELVGEDPRTITGKTIKTVHRSCSHPTLFLNFSDETSYQIMVAGYDPSPSHRSGGIQKRLELDEFLEPLLKYGQTTSVDLKINECALIRLTDKAFERRPSVTKESLTVALDDKAVDEQRWDQNHMALAFKFDGVDGWHTISATMEEGSPSSSSLFSGSESVASTSTSTESIQESEKIFRSYEDVFLKRLPPSSGSGSGSGSVRSKPPRVRRTSTSEWSFSSHGTGNSL